MVKANNDKNEVFQVSQTWTRKLFGEEEAIETENNLIQDHAEIDAASNSDKDQHNIYNDPNVTNETETAKVHKNVHG